MLWVIAGPTASGKTSVAIALAKALNTEIISFDSRQFFREIPIGTAAPTKEEQSQVRHHFIGNKSISETFSAGEYAEEARAFCREWFDRHKHLVAVGGSGLYLSALVHGFDDIPDVEEDVRKQVNEDIQNKGLEWLQTEVKRLDPVYYDKVDIHNPRRLGRALEVFRSTGRPLSDIQKNKTDSFPFPVKMFGIDWPRNELYHRIEQRVDMMVAEGLEEEARLVLPYRNHQALQTVGYREMFAYIDGTYTFDEAVAAIKTNTRRYAKRQLTWFRNKEKLTWMPPNTPIEQYISP